MGTPAAFHYHSSLTPLARCACLRALQASSPPRWWNSAWRCKNERQKPRAWRRIGENNPQAQRCRAVFFTPFISTRCTCSSRTCGLSHCPRNSPLRYRERDELIVVILKVGFCWHFLQSECLVKAWVSSTFFCYGQFKGCRFVWVFFSYI